MKQINISSQMGNRITRTHFIDEDKNEIRVDVWFESECNVSNNNTYYVYAINKRGYRCRNFHYIGKSYGTKEVGKYLPEQDLYTAFHNHWDNINPLKAFANGMINSQYINFKVKEILPTNSDNMFSL